jgi:MFS transporter, MFS domain-containing protein family, molybdate-anion transporter
LHADVVEGFFSLIVLTSTQLKSYGLNISALFLTGFLSSALLGNVVGPIVDKYGRRKACLVFCVLEIVINALENVPSMAVLLLGRVLGGVSTSLLFSAFESWMVTEHRARGTLCADDCSVTVPVANSSIWLL